MSALFLMKATAISVLIYIIVSTLLRAATFRILTEKKKDTL